MKRVIVIGGGPAGCAAALELGRQRSLQTIMLERYGPDRPKCCAGGLSPWTLDLLDEMGLGQKVRAEANPIKAANVITPLGDVMRLYGRLQSAVLPRDRFDALLADEAARANVEIRHDVTVNALKTGDSGVVEGVETSTGALEADGVIVAAGSRWKLNQGNGEVTTGKNDGKGKLFGVLARYRGLGKTDPHCLELYFDPSVRPHYCWVFPEGHGIANVGLCFQGDAKGPGARRLLERFESRYLAERLAGAERVGRIMAHPIRATSLLWRPTPERGVVYVGEAAGLVDPLTCEGIYHALKSGRCGARLLTRWFEADGFHVGLLDHRCLATRFDLAARQGASRATKLVARSFALPLASRLLSVTPLRRALERVYASL